MRLWYNTMFIIYINVTDKVYLSVVIGILIRWFKASLENKTIESSWLDNTWFSTSFMIMMIITINRKKEQMKLALYIIARNMCIWIWKKKTNKQTNTQTKQTNKQTKKSPEVFFFLMYLVMQYNCTSHYPFWKTKRLVTTFLLTTLSFNMSHLPLLI